LAGCEDCPLQLECGGTNCRTNCKRVERPSIITTPRISLNASCVIPLLALHEQQGIRPRISARRDQNPTDPECADQILQLRSWLIGSSPINTPE